MADEEVYLVVKGYQYGGWKAIRITRSIESLAGEFALDVSDRWGEVGDPWPIAEEDPCKVAIGGTVVIDGYIDKRSLTANATARTLTYTGRDRAAALVDCSAVLDSWTFRNITIADFATTLAEPFGIKVSVQAGLELAKIAKIAVAPGDKVFAAIKRAAGAQGLLFVSDGAGGVVITRAGTARATSLVEGENILTAQLEYDSTSRFYRYVVATQVAGTDTASGNATRIKAEAIDSGVQRTERARLIRTDKGYTVADARARADWEARIRAARAETATVSVPGWTQPDGSLWPLNALAHVKAPRMIGVDGDMLISQVEHSVGDQGKVTQLKLVRPDAFTPQPVKAKVGSAGGWNELKNGGV